MSSERYIIGQEMLQRVDGKGGEAVVDSLRDIAPRFRPLSDWSSPSAIFTPGQGSIYAAGKSPPSPRSRRWVTPSHS